MGIKYYFNRQMADQKEDMELFSIEQPEFDQSSYQGRFMSFVRVCNPRLAFCSDHRILEM